MTSNSFQLRQFLKPLKPSQRSDSEGNLGRVAQPLRIAVSGGTVSPPINDTLAILGKNSTIARIDRCVEALGAEVETKTETDSNASS